MKLFIKILFLIIINYTGTSRSASLVCEEELQKKYDKKGIKTYIYPRQIIALRNSFMQKVNIWEELNGREMHPIDLIYPYLYSKETKAPIFLKTASIVPSIFNKEINPKKNKKLIHDVVLASIIWRRMRWVFLRKFQRYNRIDYLFAVQIVKEAAFLGSHNARRDLCLLMEIATWGLLFRRIKLEEKKSVIFEIVSFPQYLKISIPPQQRSLFSICKEYLTADELDILLPTIFRDPIDLPLYGLRAEPPLEPRSMWERIRGIKKPIPECLRDPSVMEGEGPYLDMIPPKGFSVFAHAFPEFRDEILGFEAYGMDRGPVIYRGLMDPPPYPVEMITDGEGEDHPSGAAAAASSVSATGPAAAAAASSADVALPAAAEGVDSETVMLLRKRR